MASTIPETLPSKASVGEALLFSALQKLPKNCIVYYEPRIDRRNPDFIVILPEVGILIIEVKGWFIGNIEAANKQLVYVKGPGGLAQSKHPTVQARDYMLRLMNLCQRHPALRHLLHQEGKRKGQFVIPFGHMAILSHIRSDQLRASQWREIFPEAEVATRDVLDAWQLLSSDELVAELKQYFDPIWPAVLSREQVQSLRAAIHPEIVIGKLAVDGAAENERSLPLQVLDVRQERQARNIGSGHRVLYGVAGSGKTILLLARARLLAEVDGTARILVLCYNRCLADYLRGSLAENRQQISVYHFHAWAVESGASFSKDEADLGRSLLKALEEQGDRVRKYDAILVDEAQDFAPEWFRCVVRSLADPENGDLLIVGDGNQKIYGRNRKWTWKDVGIKASGRTSSGRLGLNRNYRNSREIVEYAALFATSSNLVDEDQPLPSVQLDPRRANRFTGRRLQVLGCRDRQHECEKAAQLARELVAGKWLDSEIEPLRPDQIGILYPITRDKDAGLIETLLVSLKDLGALWLNARKGKAKGTYLDPGVKVQTIHSSKGLQYRAVILIFTDELPRQFQNCSEEEDQRLMYVAMTRAEDFLAIVHSNGSPFIDRLT